jgi:hypothetical protein
MRRPFGKDQDMSTPTQHRSAPGSHTKRRFTKPKHEAVAQPDNSISLSLTFAITTSI